jgi:GntR family transcriptional regulator
MTALRLHLQPGSSLARQVAYAVKKALVSGQIKPGDRFPSVRAISKQLKINPNTAHKAVTQLIEEGLLEVKVGVGTVVAAHGRSTGSERSRLLREELEKLVVEAKKLGMSLDAILDAVSGHWRRLAAKQAARPNTRMLR